MPYRCHRKFRDDVEYLEPFIEPPHNATDITDFILRLQEPERSICRSVVLEGEIIGQVAAAHRIPCHRVGQILRSSLLPLAEDFGIVPRHFRK